MFETAPALGMKVMELPASKPRRSPESTQVDALLGIRNLTSDVVADLESSGERVPQPIADRTYSGEFKLRIPPELHRALAIEAAEEKVSLNRLVSSRLSR